MFRDTAQYFHSKHLKVHLIVRKKENFQRNGVLGPKRFFSSKFIATCFFMPTSPNLFWTQNGSLFLLFVKTYFFFEVLTCKAFKHCMFELGLQIFLYDQNLFLTNRILDSNLIKSDLISFKNNSNLGLVQNK